MYERKKCLINHSTRFKINEWVKYCHDSSQCFFGIVIDITDTSVYNYTYLVRWMNKEPITTEEIDGIWLERR